MWLEQLSFYQYTSLDLCPPSQADSMLRCLDGQDQTVFRRPYSRDAGEPRRPLAVRKIAAQALGWRKDGSWDVDALSSR